MTPEVRWARVTDEQRESRAARRWSALAYACGIASALVVAYFVAHVPVQVSDSLGNMLEIQHDTYRRLFVTQFLAHGYMRPLLWIQIKMAFDLAFGHYWLMFKTIHAVQLVLTALLFVRLLGVRTRSDFAVVPLALAVLFGVHTFTGTVSEAFPINGYLTMVICALAGANLSISRPRWTIDVAAALLLVLALLTVESGLLVVVAVVAGWLAGLRGVSKWGVLACVAITAGYFYLRFGPLGVGAPGLIERSSGYGLGMLDPPELIARFGARPYLFYAYNVACSMATVLFSEPRAGVWLLAKRIITHDDVPPWLAINIVSSVLTTVLVVWCSARGLRRWWSDRATGNDRVAFVAAGVMVANAVLSYPYTKDVIMSVGGVFFAVLVYVAVRDLTAGALDFGLPAKVWSLLVVAALSAGWAVRAAGLPVRLLQYASLTRNDWATVYAWLDGQHIDVSRPDARALVEQLRSDALAADPLQVTVIEPPPYFRYFDPQ